MGFSFFADVAGKNNLFFTWTFLVPEFKGCGTEYMSCVYKTVPDAFTEPFHYVILLPLNEGEDHEHIFSCI